MRRDFSGRILASVLFAVALLCACRGGVGLPPASMLSAAGARPAANPAGKIKHVVIIIQENRSFNDLFMGFPGAKTQSYGYISSGKKVALKSWTLATGWDLEHNSQGFYAACNGAGSIPGTDCRMNGFNNETCQAVKAPCPKYEYPEYIYATPSEVKPYWSMAQQYVLADEMYASNFDTSSYVSHQYIIAAQASAGPNLMQTNYPSINWGCPGGSTKASYVPTIKMDPPRTPAPNHSSVCFDYKTLGDELDAAKLSWSYYAAPLGVVGPGGTTCGKKGGAQEDGYTETGIWSAYQAIEHICYGPDWKKDIISPPPQFLKDVAAGNLRDVTWITPYCKDSDHPGCVYPEDGGPSWVASLVNAIGQSQFWNSTAIFIFWDDYGGFYDAQAPTYLKNYPDSFGLRIPMIVISPYAKKGYVSHTRYEHGSILKFIEDRFGLAHLAASDARANSPLDCFDFSQRPRKFVPIRSKYDVGHFLHESPDLTPPDTN
jgi:phospholipase C